VETQDKNNITVTIRLNRPGLLIGKAGKDIDAVRDMLESYFNKGTKINIVEVKNDVNVPYCEF
jgi:small subunit ribosomal protein S3